MKCLYQLLSGDGEKALRGITLTKYGMAAWYDSTLYKNMEDPNIDVAMQARADFILGTNQESLAVMLIGDLIYFHCSRRDEVWRKVEYSHDFLDFLDKI